MQNDAHNKPLDETPFVPFETAWASLQPALDKEAARRKNRKRRFIIFWISILAIGVFGTFLLKHTNSNAIPAIAKGKTTSIPNTNGVPPTVVLPPIAITTIDSKRNAITTLVNCKAHEGVTQKQDKTSIEHAHINTLKDSMIGESLSPGITSASLSTPLVAGIESSDDSRKKTGFSTLVADTASVVVNTKKYVSNDSSIPKKDSFLSQLQPVQNQPSNSTKVNKAFSFGIRLNAPLHAGMNTYNVNIEKKPLSLCVPTVFISKQITQKQSLFLSINPYAQYYVNNKAVLASHSYTIFLQRGTTQNDAPLAYTAIQTLAINKLMGIEASLLYQYQLAPKWQLGIGVGNLWVQNALLVNKITQSNAGTTKDSIYGLDSRSSGWSLVKNKLLIGKLEACYTTKKVAIGLDVSVPFDDVANTVIDNRKIMNKNLFVRWVFK